MSLSKEKQDEILNSAQRYFNEGMYDKATPLLHSLVSHNLKSAPVFHMLGTIYYEQSKFKQSIQSFRKALELDPGFTDSAVGLSVVLNDLGKYEEAQQVFLEAQKRLKTKTENPTQISDHLVERHWELVDMYRQHGMHREAINQIIAIEGLAGQTEHTLRQKCSIYRKIKKFEFAIGLIESWKANNEMQEKTFTQLAELYFLNREPLKALTCCEEALEHFPENKVIDKLYNQVKTSTLDLRGEFS